MTGEVEYQVPNAGPNGGRGRIDQLNKINGYTWEIKPDNPAGLANGELEVDNYIAKGNMYCAGSFGSPALFQRGVGYGTKILAAGSNGRFLKVREAIGGGVLLYSYVNTAPPNYVPLPSTIKESLKELVRRMRENEGDQDRIVIEFLRDPRHKPLLDLLHTSSNIAAVVLIVGTLVEDFVTLGAGTADDVLCFSLAYRFYRIGKLIQQ